MENALQLGCNLTIVIYSACWGSEANWNIKILILARESEITSVYLV